MRERAHHLPLFWCMTLAGVLLGGCSGGHDAASAEAAATELHFVAKAGSAPFSCGSKLEGMGSGLAQAEPMDLRIYLHDVALRRETGDAVPFGLLPDAAWQSERLALLDFEDGSGRCEHGTEATNTTLRGSAPQHTDYVGLSFTLGVPPELNHLNLSTAEAPLNEPGMWWSWQGGYKYVRAELQTDANQDGYLFHLGADGCEGSPSAGYECERQSLATITLLGDIRRPITLDLQALFAGVDLAQTPNLKDDLVPGCMSSPSDPECGPLFERLGLPTGEQTVFSLP
jgi:uncharacterized repeat protein (TIGR04052 family)